MVVKSHPVVVQYQQSMLLLTLVVVEVVVDLLMGKVEQVVLVFVL
jgi:hypothetical protein